MIGKESIDIVGESSARYVGKLRINPEIPRPELKIHGDSKELRSKDSINDECN